MTYIDGDATNGGSRQRRQFSYIVCYQSVITCGDIRFLDSRFGFYFGCPPTCIRVPVFY